MKPPSVEDIPFEVWSLIFAMMWVDDLLRARLACKLFNAVITRRIYRAMTLQRPRETLRALKILQVNDNAAESVCVLTIEDGMTKTSAHFHLLSTVLGRLHNVVHLSIKFAIDNETFDQEVGTFAERFAAIIKQCDFPHLKELDLKLPMARGSIEFLRAHQERIEVLVIDALYREVELPVAHMDFSKVMHLGASATTAAYLFTHSTFPELTHPTIYWQFDEDEVTYDDVFTPCSRSVNLQNIRVLSVTRCCCRGWAIEVIKMACSLFPRLTGLTIELDEPEDLPVLDLDTLLSLTETLTKFCVLNKLKWHVTRPKSFPPLSMPPRRFSPNQEHEMIVAYGTACPTLQDCQIPSGSQWTRIKNEIWYPREARQSRASRSAPDYTWFIEKLETERYPQMEQLLSHIESVAETKSKIDEARQVIQKFKECKGDERGYATEDLIWLGEELEIWDYSADLAW